MAGTSTTSERDEVIDFTQTYTPPIPSVFFGRATPVVQGSSPIVTEMAVNGISLDEFKDAEAKVQEAKEILEDVESEIEEPKATLQNVCSEAEEAKETLREVGLDVKDLLGR